MAGMLATFKEADKMQSDMITMGFTDAVIVPYLNGIRLTISEIPNYYVPYPDLEFYMERVKK
jgi:hypothetical protein